MSSLAALDPVTVAIFCGIFATIAALLVATVGSDRNAERQRIRLDRVGVRPAAYAEADLAATISRRDRQNRQQRMENLFGRSLPKHAALRSEEHTSELQSLMRISYAVFCLKKKTIT